LVAPIDENLRVRFRVSHHSPASRTMYGRSPTWKPRQTVFTLDHDVQNRSPANLAKYAKIEAFANKHEVDFADSAVHVGVAVTRDRHDPGERIPFFDHDLVTDASPGGFTLDHDVQNRSPANLAKYAKIEAFANKHEVDFYSAAASVRTIAVPTQPTPPYMLEWLSLATVMTPGSPANLAKYAKIEAFANKHEVDFYPAGRGIGHQISWSRVKTVCRGFEILVAPIDENLRVRFRVSHHSPPRQVCQD
jgi:hypothetical protein